MDWLTQYIKNIEKEKDILKPILEFKEKKKIIE